MKKQQVYRFINNPEAIQSFNDFEIWEDGTSWANLLAGAEFEILQDKGYESYDIKLLTGEIIHDVILDDCILG